MSGVHDLSTGLGRREAARERAGCRSIKLARETRTPVGVYRAVEAGMDCTPKTRGLGPWLTVCEVHNSIMEWSTRSLATQWAPEPTSWCMECKAQARAAAPRSAP